jgi:hypothetical protein
MTGRRNSERGAITPGIVVAVVVMSVVALGAVQIGRIAAVRTDAQNAADSAALAALDLIRERGLPFDQASRDAAENVARRNSQLPIAFQWNVEEDADSVDITVQTFIDVDVPLLVFDTGVKTVDALAAAQIAQSRFDDAERRLPKLVMALDYSGSMALPFSGGNSRAIDVLEDSVAALLAADLMIDYGAAFYSSSVFRTVGISANAPNEIIGIMNQYDAGGVTNTAAALNTAGNVLTANDNTGYYALLVSDGEPCCGSNSFSAARAAAQNLWNRDVTIFTLEIRRSNSSSALSQFMTDVAGSPASQGDPNFHFVATSAADLLNEFESIVASIVCKVGPMSPAPADLTSLRVFLTNGGNERRIPESNNLVADRNIEAWAYEAGDQTIRLTEAACDAIIDGGDDVVARFDRPSLTQ